MMILENPGARFLAGTAQTADDAIIVEDLSKHYGHFGAVKNVSLSIHRGEVFGLLGPNGAGKTTLIECIVGLRSPSAGQIKVLGMNPRAERRAFTSRVAVQPQEASLFDGLRVAEALKLFASMHDNPFPIPDVLAQIGLAEFSRSLVRKLSGGQRRRLLLGVAMIGRPEVIVEKMAQVRAERAEHTKQELLRVRELPAVEAWRRRWRLSMDSYLDKAGKSSSINRSPQHLVFHQSHMMLNRLGFLPREEAVLGIHARHWSE